MRAREREREEEERDKDRKREGGRKREAQREKGGNGAVGLGEENYWRDNAGSSCRKIQGEDPRTYPKTVEGVGECLCRAWFWGHQAVTVTA